MQESAQDNSALVSKDVLSLQSARSSRRLEQIASLRARGVGDHVNLPQVVVCGDQSSGKSSVLEGLTGIPFPRQDGMCTRFATEIILEHAARPMEIIASILPGPSQIASQAATLRGFERRLAGFNELPAIIDEVGGLMGIRGCDGNEMGSGFSDDVLRIKVQGQTGLHLSVVDLPGLISTPNEDQTEDDVDTVHSLVDSYAQNPRTIILAVVQAGNDIANQSIIRKSREFDKLGQRTVGIITKPDLINKGTEARIALLAKNQDTTKLKLGFFIVKNPTPTDLEKGMALEQRHDAESRFFRSPEWSHHGLDSARVGILALRRYVQTLLDQHVERELPKVREELRNLLRTTEDEIAHLGDERTTTSHMRMYLSRLAMKFRALVVAGLEGQYMETDADFFSVKSDKPFLRLRALVHQLNTDFSTKMRLNGQKRKVDDNRPFEDDEEDGCLLVNYAEMKEWVKKVYAETRGRELPGNYNHVLLSALFHEQSSRWLTFAEAHLKEVYTGVIAFVREGLRHVSNEEKLLNDLFEEVEVQLQEQQRSAQKELESLWMDEKQAPMTYNHYYTDNVQKARQNTARDAIRRAMKEASVEEYHGKMHISNNTVDAEKLLASLQKRVIVDMDEQACLEALAGLDAYYKVARKTFVDNVCRQVVERHLLRHLPTVFSPNAVSGFQDDVLERLAAESADQVAQRHHLRERLQIVRSGLEDLSS